MIGKSVSHLPREICENWMKNLRYTIFNSFTGKTMIGKIISHDPSKYGSACWRTKLRKVQAVVGCSKVTHEHCEWM